MPSSGKSGELPGEAAPSLAPTKSELPTATPDNRAAGLCDARVREIGIGTDACPLARHVADR